MACEADKCDSETPKNISSGSHPTPFNLGPAGVLFIFCIIMSLASSLYHNWPAIEKIFIDDRVFESLCTLQQRKNAIPGYFVCDKQRDAIGDLTLYVFFSEFAAFSLCGPLADVLGVFIILMIGFTTGLFAFLLMFYSQSNAVLLKLACCSWGFSGGSVIIVSVHFARMFPDTTSLADGMMIFFENVSSVVPIIIGRIMRSYKLTYYQAFGTYVIWGLVPSFLLAVSFIPTKILSRNERKQDPSKLVVELKKRELWMNLLIFSIPVTASVFYRKMFSAYFLNNQWLIQIFPIIQLFVFLPTPFVAVLDQFLGIHITSSLLYLCYMISFACFLYPTRGYGLVSILCFVVAHAAEHQIMHYISEHHPNYESTLMGISYAVVCVVGTVLERIFTSIYNKLSPRAVIYIINALLALSICFSVYCHLDQTAKKHGATSATSYRIIYVILWLVPFLFMCILLSFKNIYHLSTKTTEKTDKHFIINYLQQKVSTISITFYSFTFYYVCNIFLVLVRIFEFSNRFQSQKLRNFTLFCFLFCYFVLPQILVFIKCRFIKTYLNVSIFIFLLCICKILLYVFQYFINADGFVPMFSTFLFIYGLVFFMFNQMLSYYNFQLTYSERLYRSSLLHIGTTFTVFMLFRFFYKELQIFTSRYLVLWVFSFCYFIFFSVILFFYFSYEMDIDFTFKSFNLSFPKGFDDLSKSIKDNGFFEIGTNVALAIVNFALLINFSVSRRLHFLLIGLLVIDALSAMSVLCPKFSDYGKKSFAAVWFFSIISIILFILISGLRIMISKDFNNRLAVVILVFTNFIVITFSNNLCWLKVQFELQQKENCNCCCKHIDKDCCKNGCCSHLTKNGKCICSASDCDLCIKDFYENIAQCVDCVLNKCSKRTFEDNGKIVFCFFQSEFEKVISTYVSYYFGTVIGWIVFIFYIAISRDRLFFNAPVEV